MKKIPYVVIVVVLSLIFISTAGFATTVGVAADAKGLAKQAAADKKAEAKAALIDVNTATKAELAALPGIGDTYAQKIMDGRPYVKKDQLKSKKIIPAAVYDKIRDMIIAKQPLPKK